MKTTKLEIAEFVNELSSLFREVGEQFNGQRVSLNDRYYIGIVQRSHVLLSDIEMILRGRSEFRITSAFILCRCLLDDFITLLYLDSKGFDEDELLKLTAKAYENKYKMFKNSALINRKHFSDSEPTLATDAMYEAEMSEFCSNPDNAVYFENVATRKWKSSTTTTSMIRDLEHTPIASANAHALVLWQLLSNYVHYSSLTEVLERHQPSREIEISQLREALTYVYKSLLICSSVLNGYGITNRIRENDLFERLTADEEV